MRDWKRIRGRLWFGWTIVTTCLIVGAIGWTSLSWGLGKVICEDTVSAMTPGPPATNPRYITGIRLDHDYTTYVWSRNCGATTNFNTKVYIAVPQDHFPDDREAVFESHLAPEQLWLRWEDHDHLVIEYQSDGGKPYTKKLVAQWEDVTITLRTRTSGR